MKTIVEVIGSEIERYMALPYKVELVKDEGGWFVSIPELPMCISQGRTPDEALEMIRDAQRLWIQVALEDGDPVPLPTAEAHSFSGKFNVRVPKDLHRRLVYEAERQGVSLNLFVATALARTVGTNITRSIDPALDIYGKIPYIIEIRS